MTSVDRDDMYKLFQSMNKALGENALEETRLKKMFELSWNEIDTALKGIEDISTEEGKKLRPAKNFRRDVRFIKVSASYAP